MALCKFSNLKRLSWTGLSSQGEFDSLANVLNQVSHQLEELDIDLTYYRDWYHRRGYKYDRKRRNIQSIVKMLGLSTPPSRKFPHLKRLALTAVPIPKPKRNPSISGSFGFSSLQSLKLQNCEGWWDLLNQLLTNRAEPLRLRSLEIQCAAIYHPGGVHVIAEIVNVLQKTQGLEELFLGTEYLGGLDIVELWKTVFHHHASVRRFVHHLADFDNDEESENYGWTRDISDLGGIIDPWSGKTQLPPLQFVGSMDLTSLGVCCTPDLMVRNSRYATSGPFATDILNRDSWCPCSLQTSPCKCCIYGSQART